MVVTDYGAPLQLAEVPEPELSDGQALLEIITCGVCFSDVKTSRGHMPYSDDLPLPHVPGHEIYGRVLATRPTGLLAEGSRAVVYHYWPCGRCRACQRGDETLCAEMSAWVGFTHHGGFRERIAVPLDRLIPVPPTIEAVRAAPLTCALGTAYRSVVTRAGAQPGISVAVIGLGGVGIHAAQIARVSGADTTGFDLHEPTLETARGLGLLAQRSDDETAAKDAVSRAGGEGVDAVIDTVGMRETLGLARRLVRRGGKVVGVGYNPATSLEVPTPSFVLDEVTYMGSRYAHRDEVVRAIGLVARELVTPVVGMVRPLEAVNEVLEALESGDIVGRAVLEVNTTS
jgi:D-arabinose 1-dehydrogenase-like Zn-dependent alcohol dehydrogenase